MNIFDALDIGWELSGRHLKQWAARGFLLIMILCPAAGTAALTWYATQYGKHIQHEIERIVIPRLSPTTSAAQP